MQCLHWALRQRISTHDLTRRSTFLLSLDEIGGGYFNSRPHEEVDLPKIEAAVEVVTFQLTTSRGGRPEKRN